MADTIQDLYLNYTSSVADALEDDRYFQYLYEMAQAGANTLKQTNQVVNKIVDERWLSTIENSLDAINNIIEKPRRFIATNEEVVPVSLAKKITADSVRHLSMNTQLIASNENNEIQPIKILNISTEESFDLYENRFIYHLIQRLITFVDKRTDVIFWSTGNEKRNTLLMESKIDDAYEQIEYKIEMSIKNLQSFAENDGDNMDVFMRIDRVRRLVLALRSSAFCSIMAGCSMVRSPIQRTNLMMKDPNYKACYKLWQFLESYDEVGYTVVATDTSIQFDEEYMVQMYTNLIANYTVFKSLLERDKRDIAEVGRKRRKVKSPKFIKTVKEQFVDNYDIEDVEIRKVFVEQVTQAQLDAQQKLEEETALRMQLEQTQVQLQTQISDLFYQVDTLREQKRQTEKALEDSVISLKTTETLLQKTKEQAKKELELSQNENKRIQQDAKAASLQAKAVLEQTKQQFKNEIDENYANTQKQINAANNMVEQTKAQAKQQIAEMQRTAKQQVDSANIKIEQAKIEKNHAIEQEKLHAKTKIDSANTNAQRKIEDAQKMVLKHTQALKDAQKEIMELQNALEKAKKITISDYFISTFQRKNKGKKED